MQYPPTDSTAGKLVTLLRRFGYRWQGGTIFRSPAPYVWTIWGSAPSLEATARLMNKRLNSAAYTKQYDAITGGL